MSSDAPEPADGPPPSGTPPSGTPPSGPLPSGPPPSVLPRPARILVVGCGGIGGILAASLIHQGHDVTPLTRNALIADAINSDGFRTRGELNIGTVVGSAVCKLPAKCPPFDFVLLATQPPQVGQAARQVLPHLADDGHLVCFQNGLCELRIANIVQPERIIGAIVAWGASMVEPGVYDRTSAGGFVLGRLDGSITPALPRLGHLLEAVGPVSTTNNLLGARWSKLAINCAISSLGTVGGERLGILLRHRFVRRLALEVMTEAVEVARAHSIGLEKVSGTLDLDWIALTQRERATRLGSASLVAKHALLLAVGTRYRRLRSSMLNAIERGRTPAVDFLNGEVVDRAKKHGIDTPVNAALLSEVWRITDDKSQPSIATLKALFAASRKSHSAAQPTGDPPRPTGDPPKPTGDPPKPTGDPPKPTGDPPAEQREADEPEAS